MRRIRGNRIAMIFQEPTTALDVTIQVQILERREKLAALIGNYEFGYSLRELEEMRNDG